VRERLLTIFGAAQRLSIQALAGPDAPDGKLIQYTSDLA
jgi:hypothetical protein